MDNQFYSSKLTKESSKPLKAIIYCRVSTTEQALSGTSLTSQEKICRSYASNNSYDVLKIFIERGESAKTTNRTQLKNLLEFARKNHSQIDVLIVYKLDRLARNMVDYTNLVQHFGGLGIDIKSATENIDESPTGKLMKNIIASFAQFDNDVRSERILTGMMQAVKEGRWCWQPPFGYKFNRDVLNRPILVPTEESEIVKEAFKIAEKGLYLQTEIVQLLAMKGFKISKQKLNRILGNPLYAGFIKVAWYPDYIDAIHEPIISKETFFTVHRILKGEKPVIVPHLRNNPDFPLRNFVICSHCGRKLTGAWSRGKKGKKYPYYKCQTNGCSLNIRKQDLEKKFYEYLTDLQPIPEILELFEVVIKDIWETKQNDKEQDQKRHENQLTQLKEKKNRLVDLMIDGIFEKEVYETKFEEINEQIILKKLELSEASIDLYDVEAYIKYCKFFISNIANLWASADLNLKQKFQNLVFPQEIYFDKEQYRTPQLSHIFTFIKNLTSESHLVEAAGLEPAS